MSSKLFVVALVVAFAVVLVANGFPKQLPAQTTGDELIAVYQAECEQNKRIDDALDSSVSFAAKEISLNHYQQILRDKCAINVDIDVAGIDRAGLDAEDLIQVVEVQNVPLRDAIQQSLDGLDLTFLVYSGALVITEWNADSGESRRIFDVTHLTSRAVDNDFDLVRHGRSNAKRAANLIDVLQTTVRPDCWSRTGGTSVMVASNAGGKTLLLVCAAESVHKELTITLGEMSLATQSRPDSSSNSSTVSGLPLLPDREFMTCVYPLETDKMTSEQAAELVKLALGDSLQLEMKAVLLKAIGCTLIVRHEKRIQDRIFHLLESSGVLVSATDEVTDLTEVNRLANEIPQELQHAGRFTGCF